MNNPIFIGGCSRSGTTMLASMLSSNQGFIAIPESHFKVDLLKKIHPDINGLYDTNQLIRYVRNHVRYKIWCVEKPIVIEQQKIDLQTFIDHIVNLYAEQHHFENFSTWIDHTPGNIEHAPVLSQIFKDSKFVHIVRDGRGFASSVKKLDWGFHDLIIIGRYWRDTLTRDLNNEMMLGDRVLRMYYEDLVNDPEKSLKKVCQFLNIQFSENMLKANGFVKPSYTKSQHKLVGKGVHKNRAKAWQEELTDRDIELFETVAGKMLTHLEYDTQFKKPNGKLSIIEKITFKSRNVFYKYYDSYKLKKRKKNNILN